MSTASKVRELTGARTRIVWIRQQQGCNNYIGLEPDFKLMAFDTDDGERELIGTVGAYACPMMTPSGDRVVYTDNEALTVNVINWDGTGKRVLSPGYGVTVWRDPATGIEWVYVRPNTTRTWVSKSRPLTRVQIDNPSVVEMIWERKSISWGWFQLSPDGSRAATVMFWPTCGMLDMTRRRFTKFDEGCWTAMAPDNSYRMWVFDPDHRTVKLYDRKGTRLCRLDIHEAPGIRDWEIYHPRWSNHLRFITVTGPYSDNRDHACDRAIFKSYLPEGRCNLIHEGGYNVELYLGRLTEAIDGVEEWVKITDNEKADFYGDAWVEPRPRQALK